MAENYIASSGKNDKRKRSFVSCDRMTGKISDFSLGTCLDRLLPTVKKKLNLESL